jgi:MFS family permease
VALSLLSGYWSDRFPKRKPFVFVGHAISSVFKLVLALFNLWQQVLGAILVMAVGFAALLPFLWVKDSDLIAIHTVVSQFDPPEADSTRTV